MQVQEIKKNKVFVLLLEHNGIKGLMFITEITLDKAFYALRHIRVRNELALRVLNVNPEIGFISLYKIRVDYKDAEKCKQKYINSKIVDGIIYLIFIFITFFSFNIYIFFICKFTFFNMNFII